ncbi:MAG: hypothetical protein AB7F74_15080 [Parvibaculaceae bacterium]
MPRLKVRIGTALTGLVLVAVLATALIVHISWMRTATRNVETIVGSINVQTAGAVKKELEATFRASEGAVEVIRPSCQRAKARWLALFHHAPERNDAEIDRLETLARTHFAGAFAAREGMSIRL